MQEQRKTVILLGSGTLFAFWTLAFLAILTGNLHAAFYWGNAIGIVFGVGTWVYLSEAWDPVNLKTTGNRKQADWRVLWVVPFSVVLTRVLDNWISDEISDLLLGAALTWVSLTMGYMVFQAWRYRPK